MARKKPDTSNIEEEVVVREENSVGEEGGEAAEIRQSLVARAAEITPKEVEVHPVPNQYVQLKISRKFLLSMGVVTIFFGLGVLAWQQNWYGQARDAYNRASVTFRVREGETIVLPGATVVLNGVTYTTDETGSIILPEIIDGKSYEVKVSRDGYDDLVATLELVRGDNGAKVFSLTKKPIPLYAMSVVVKDAVSGLPLKGVQVSGSSRTITTGDSGEVSFDKLPAGKYQLTLSKSGYRNVQQEVNLSAETGPTAISLVPSGQVVFTSKRTGRRGIYSANLDGTNQVQIAAATNSAKSEDYAPRLSPDGRYVAFASTRDGVVSKFGSALARVYIADASGRNAKAIDGGYFVSGPWWSSDGSLVSYTYATDDTLSQTRVLIYNPSKGSVFFPGDNVDPFAGYMFRGTGGRDGIPFLYVSGTTVLVLENRALEGTSLKQPALVLIDTDSGSRRTIYEGAAGEGMSEIQLSPDGLTVTAKVTAAFPDTITTNYRITLKDGGKTTIPAVATSPSDARVFTTSPTGAIRLFVEERDGKSDLYSLDKAGNEKRLSSFGSVASVPSPTFDPTGNFAIFTVVRSGEQAFYIVSLSGGEPKKVVDITLDN